MSNEYIPIVLDLGSRFTSIGYVGEPHPTITVPTTRESTPNEESFPPYLDVSNYSLDHNERQLLKERIQADPVLCRVAEIHQQDLTAAQWPSQKLHRSIKSLLSTKLLVLPTRCKVILIHDASLLENYKLCKMLLFDLRIKSVMYQPSSIMTLIGANLRNGLVISIGWSSLKIDLIFDLRLLKEHSYRDDKFQTGYSLHYRIIEKIIELEDETLQEKLLLSADLFQIIDRFITKAVFVRPQDTLEEAEDYEIIESVRVPGRIRYEVVESMFFASERNLAKTVCQIVEGTEVDLRTQLLENVVFDGGVTKIPGFKTRVLQELRQLSLRKYCGKMTIGAWSATSLYCAHALLKSDLKKIEIKRDTIRELEKDDSINLVPLGQYIA